MSLQDEHLQNKIEKGGAGDSIDADAYKIVFDALRHEPDYQLSANFADKVLAKIESKRESSRDILWLSLGIFSIIMVSVIATLVTHIKLPSVPFKNLKFLTSSPGLIIFGILFIIVLQWVDRKLIRPSINH